MAHLLVCLRNDTTIVEHGIYSRDLAPVKFDDSAVGLALRHDPCFDRSQYFVICKRTLHVTNPSNKPSLWHGSVPNVVNSSNAVRCTCDSEPSYTLQKCDFCSMKVKTVEVHTVSFIQLQAEYLLNVCLPVHVAGYCLEAFTSSQVFRTNFINFVRCRLKCKWMDCRDQICHCKNVHESVELKLTIPRLIQVFMQPKEENVCLAWCYRVEGLAKKRLMMEETMAWLSSLGGGFSSLGDYMNHFSVLAGKLSTTQLKIAVEMGDPVLASKCRLFYALSAMQRGYLRNSKHMIRSEYAIATKSENKDQKLAHMCRGMWAKLQFFYSKKKSLRKTEKLRNGVNTHFVSLR